MTEDLPPDVSETWEVPPQLVLMPQTLSLTERIATGILIGADLAGLGIATALTIYLLTIRTPYISYFGIGPLFAMIALYLINGYNRRTDFLSLEYLSESLIAIVLSAACAMLIAYVYSAFNISVKPSRAAIPIQMGIFFLISTAARRFVGIRIQNKHTRGSLLVIGEGKKAERFYRKCTDSGVRRKVEFIKPTGESARGPSFGFLSLPAEERISQGKASQTFEFVAVALACEVSQLHPAVLRQLIRLHCSGVPVHTAEAFHEQHWQRVSAQAAGPEWLFASEFRLAHGSVYSQLKRLIDLAFSTGMIAFLSPLLFCIACIVRMDSRGPVIFRQQRVGRECRVFTMFKFRTMHENNGDIYTQSCDDRITRAGHWLRRFRLDELPQLWNVLIGDMSLIGPRAEWVKCADIYEREIPHYHIRHLVSPGITGWAQVRYPYGESADDALKKFEYDLYYIRHFSWKMDFRILIKTIYIMIRGSGR